MDAYAELLAALRDPEPRVRFFAANEAEREEAIVAMCHISFGFRGRLGFCTSHAFTSSSGTPSCQSIRVDKGSQLVCEELL